MGYVGNTNQWQPYAYKDCSLEICSIYCPQWCYIIFPPPPPFGYPNSSTDFSPLIIAIIGILATAFILVSYYTIISKHCNKNTPTMEIDDDEQQNPSQIRHENQLQAPPPPPAGLDEALINFITVCKYKRGDGLIEGTDCSVCLSEFEENESLRLLPKCSHAFHLPCIDTWLKSHSTCPLCRSNISPTCLFVPPTQEIQRTEHLNSSVFQRSNDTVVVVVVQDLQDSTISQETDVLGLQNDAVSFKNQRQSFGSDSQDSEPFRRSVSLNSLSCQGQVSVADILRASQDSEDEVDEDEFVFLKLGNRTFAPLYPRVLPPVLRPGPEGQQEILPLNTLVGLEPENSKNACLESLKSQRMKLPLQGKDELQMEIGSSKLFVQEHCHSNYKTGVSNWGMNRSTSTGKLDSTNLGKGKSCIIPS